MQRGLAWAGHAAAGKTTPYEDELQPEDALDEDTEELELEGRELDVALPEEVGEGDRALALAFALRFATVFAPPFRLFAGGVGGGS